MSFLLWSWKKDLTLLIICVNNFCAFANNYWGEQKSLIELRVPKQSSERPTITAVIACAVVDPETTSHSGAPAGREVIGKA